MKQISTTKFRGYDGSLYTKYDTKSVSSLNQVADAIKNYVWSPCIWNGPRCKANFTHADFLALDFDDGKFTIENAKEYVKDLDLCAVIGTTRSHQKTKVSGQGKVSPPCDRFRLVLTLSRRTSDLAEYEQNYTRMRDALGCDSTQDGGRLFYPCVDILLVNSGKIGVTVKSLQKPKPRKVYPGFCEETRNSKVLPSGLRNAIVNGLRDHNHNNFTFWFSCRMKETGILNQDEIYNLIKPRTHMTDLEMRRTISSAFKTAVRK